MFILFNEKSINNCNKENIDELMQLFMQTYKLANQASELSGEKFGLLMNNNFFNYEIIKNWINEKGHNSREVIFLHQINNISQNFTNSDNNLIFSIAISEKNKNNKLTIKNQTYKNISLPKHVYKYLEYFPKWNNFDFNSWRVNFNDKKSEHLLPLAKLSDLVWLDFIDETEIWENKKQRKEFWLKFVKELRPIPDTEKISKIIEIFSKITKINGLEKYTKCKKPKRKIAKFPFNKIFYLTPDKQHGAFEVWNKQQVHQGEWAFYGKKNKKADTTRDICN